MPIHFEPYDECTGEFVDLHGTLRDVFMTTTDAAGGQHRIESILYMQLIGTGESSGNTYRSDGRSGRHPATKFGCARLSDAGIQVLPGDHP